MGQEIADRHNPSIQMKVNADGSIITELYVDGGIVSSASPLPIEDKKYNPNEVEEASSTVTYVGKENSKGAWLLQKIDTTSGTVITWATVINNSIVTSYTDAWTARASLTYGDYSEAF